jgi:hypothetical protein
VVKHEETRKKIYQMETELNFRRDAETWWRQMVLMVFSLPTKMANESREQDLSFDEIEKIYIEKTGDDKEEFIRRTEEIFRQNYLLRKG